MTIGEHKPDVFARRATISDAEEIHEALIGDQHGYFERLYGEDLNVGSVIQNAYLPIVATANIDEVSVSQELSELQPDEMPVVGFCALSGSIDHFGPLVDSVSWPEWIKLVQGGDKKPFTPFNTLWLRFFATGVPDTDIEAETPEPGDDGADNEDEDGDDNAAEIARYRRHLEEGFMLRDADVMMSMLQSAFQTLPDIDYLLLALPGETTLFAPLDDVFHRVDLNIERYPLKLYYVSRDDVLPKLIIRDGVVEDHDDLLPLLAPVREDLEERYGTYFLASLLESQDPRNRALVAEVAGEPVGLMFVTLDGFDMHALESLYDLNQFDNLYRDRGQANAFLIKLFFMNPAFESRSIDFLLPAFELFPQQDYALFTLPPTCKEFPLLQLFTRVEPQELIDDGAVGNIKELFVFHRHALARSLEVSSLSLRGIGYENAFEWDDDCSNALKSLVSKLDNKEKLSQRVNDLMGERKRLRREEILASGSKSSLLAVPLPISDGSTEQPERPGGNVPDAVRELMKTDEDVANQLDAEATKEEEQAVYEAKVPDSGSAVYRLMCQGLLVGIAVVRDEQRESAIRGCFGIDDFVDFSKIAYPASSSESQSAQRSAVAIIEHLIVSPAFQVHVRTFLREILRLRSQSVIVYYSGSEKADGSASKSVYSTIVNDLIPIPRRLLIEYPQEFKDTVESPECSTNVFMYAASLNLLSEYRERIFTRILFVGASECGIAAMEKLLTVPDLRFCNVTLISRDGLTRNLENDRFRPNVASTQKLAPSIFELCGSQVHIIDRCVHHIDARNKRVILDNDAQLPYDYLAVTAGRQLMPPVSLIEAFQSGLGGMFCPDGSDVSIDEMKHMFTDTFEPSVDELLFYGIHRLETYAILGAVVKEFQIPLSRVTLITSKPFSGALDDDERLIAQLPFTKDVSGRVLKNLRDSGVKIIEGYRITELEVDESQSLRGLCLRRAHVLRNDHHDDRDDISDADEEDIEQCAAIPEDDLSDDGDAGDRDNNSSRPSTSGTAPEGVTAESDDPLKRPPALQVTGSAVVVCTSRHVNPYLLASFHDQQLVFDGRLVVDSHFRTSDPFVLAAGSIAKFSRRCGPYPKQEEFNAVEVGTYMAEELITAIEAALAGAGDPQAQISGDVLEHSYEAASMELSECNEEHLDFSDVPKFSQPITETCVLPNGWLYFHSKAAPGSGETAGRRETVKAAEGSEEMLVILETDQLDRIHAVTYYGPPRAVVYNLDRLIGLPQRVLNRVFDRCDEGLITDDLLEFLTESWAMVLYHDKFKAFLDDVREELSEVGDVKRLRDDVEKLTMAENAVPTSEQIEDLRKQHISTKTAKMLEFKVLEFLNEHRNHLPMYYVPDPVMARKWLETYLRTAAE